ncbi:paired-like homeodomain transcription factor LEUTX [Talpa occidentalis]|uniref:paired-like homeodomain transcription factor LEUTX n=1 Tax=Talpa occidentalis TaxID=50954 RepID=UPI0018909101|nr:paired-like homeodomain transcription factor LEUTX [Talpa occidentalis]
MASLRSHGPRTHQGCPIVWAESRTELGTLELRVDAEPGFETTLWTLEKQKSVRRHRTKFTPEQLGALKDVFQKTRYPSWDTIMQLALSTKLDDLVIQTWFKNQRAKAKKSQLRGQPSQSPEAPNPHSAAEEEATPSPTTSANTISGVLGVFDPQQPKGASASESKSLGGSQPNDLQDLCLQASDLPWASSERNIYEFIELYILPGDDDTSSLDQYLPPEGAE